MSTVTKYILGMAILIILLIGALIYFIHRDTANKDNLKAFQIAMSDSFKVYHNKEGQEIASVKTAVFTNTADTKAAIAQLNKNGANIKSVVDGNTQSLILIDKKVGGELKGKTLIVGSDTVKEKVGSKQLAVGSDSIKVYPVYQVSDSTQWYSLKGKIFYDHYAITPYFKDSIELKGELSYNGLFKPRVLTVTSLSKNPYSTTTGFKSIVIQKQGAPVWRYVGGVAIFIGGIFLGRKL